MTVRERVNSRVKTLLGAKPCVFLGNVAPGVAEVRSLFPRVRASIWESCGQKTGLWQELDLYFKMLNSCHVRSTLKLSRTEGIGALFWKMRSAKCARDCSESSIYLHVRVLGKLGEWDLEDEVAKFIGSLVHWFATGSENHWSTESLIH